ncbi:hypothetical protein C8Q80DRAFT_1222339 [Daedaleopsis nitida]|nr:hypothetical protein C8Q80DRAFT_1222339 [Daedaleopsis nitida]
MGRSTKHAFRPRNIACSYATQGCRQLFSDRSGLTRHLHAKHRSIAQRPAPPRPASPAPSTSPSSREPSPDPLPPPSPGSPLGAGGSPPRSTPQPSSANSGSHVEWSPPPAPPPRAHPATSYYPFQSRAHFELADFLYRREQMSGKKIDELMQILACFFNEGQDPPFAGRADLYDHIQLIESGEPDWEHFSIVHNGPMVDPPHARIPAWKIKEYTVFFRDPRQVLHNQMANPDFQHDSDYVPKRVYNEKGQRVYKDFASGDWVWGQANALSMDPRNHGAALNTLILGSDKTTVSVATGQNEFYPLYLTNGWVTNSVRRAHRNAITLIGFLAIPKTDRQYSNDPEFRKFRRELFHTSLQYIFERLRPYMTTYYDIVRCGDGYYRRVIYGFGPYIADYPEQVLLACTVQGWCPKCTADPNDLDTGQHPRRSHELTAAHLDEGLSMRKLWEEYGIISYLTPFTAYFPRADVHELLAPDLLHQIIKGTFKDHLVTWVEEYLVLTHGKTRAAEIMADIDRRSVYLPAIVGHLPPQMVRAISAFLDFCYLVRRDTIDEDTLAAIDDALTRFHQEREIFITSGVRETISLPRQHAMKHYVRNIRLFGSPNGLCSSMMEAKHIVAVKRPYRRSSKNNTLGQILKTNERLNKLAALHVDLTARGLLDGACPHLPDYVRQITDIDHSDLEDDPNMERCASSFTSDSSVTIRILTRSFNPAAPPADGSQPHLSRRPLNDEDEDDSGAVNEHDVQVEVVLARTPVRNLPKSLSNLSQHLGFPTLPSLIRYFLYEELNPGSGLTGAQAGLAACPSFDGRIKIFPSAIATFVAPSDPSGSRGMRRERIRSVASWRGGRPRRDCVYVSKDSGAPGFGPGFRGLYVARVQVLFSFSYLTQVYECALVSWYLPVDNEPDPDTGMWVVAAEMEDCILRAAHLIGVSGQGFLPQGIGPEEALDAFCTFYVNKYADHHAFEIAF